MFPKLHFIKGFFKNFFNPRIATLSFVSSDNDIDSKACIYRMCKVKHSKLGAYSYLGNDTDVELAEIGKFTSISDHCRIGLGQHTLDLISTCPLFTQKINGTQSQWVDRNINAAKDETTIIGNDVWIGTHALISSGVTIGDGAVVAAGAVVVKNVPPYAIVGGVPAKLIRYRFSQDIIDKLIQLKWWNLPDSVLKENLNFFQKNELTIDDIDSFINRVK